MKPSYFILPALFMVLLIIVAIRWKDDKSKSKCPYEGLECPTAQQVLKDCREGKFVSQFDFKVGDTLPPSMACPDTLIVVNAKGLNEGLSKCDGTDSGIDSVLHANCDRIDGRRSIVLNDEYGYDFLTQKEIDSLTKDK